MVQLCAAPYGDNMNLLVEVLVVMIAACTPIILTVIFLFYPRNRDVYEEELYGGSKLVEITAEEYNQLIQEI